MLFKIDYFESDFLKFKLSMEENNYKFKIDFTEY